MDIAKIVREHRYESVCAAVGVILLLAILPASMLASKAREMAGQVESKNTQALSLLRPGAHGVANEFLVQARREYAKLVAAEAQKATQLFEEKNERQFLVPAMFPDPDTDQLWTFRADYKKAITNLLDQMNAGWPSDQNRSDKSSKSLGIGIYAHRGNLSIEDWAEEASKPSTEDCWFGQLDLWIQEDLLEVFRELNLASAKQRNQSPRVDNAAVKRIVQISVNPYFYSGQFGAGQPGPPGFQGYNMSGQAGTFSLPGQPGMSMYDRQSAFGGGMPAPDMSQTPMAGSGDYARKARAVRLARRLQTKPFTERVTDQNAYVLHFSFSVVADSRRINDLLAKLSHKNLYTILRVALSREDVKIDTVKFPKFDKASQDFNPYHEAGAGLLYGTDPIVRLDVEAEAVFLKEIYGKFVPKEVEETLSRKALEKVTEKIGKTKTRRSRRTRKSGSKTSKKK